ncbi:MAG: hypothetical protein ACOYVF_04445 [Candidatus Zixiibacteriota bacterium]
MFKIGLLGHEYDGCIRSLKRRIEDRGHKARVINPTHLPRVTQVTLSSDNIIHDGYDLREFDCYYLAEMGIREPFFHVTYSREMWSFLRERYLRFAAHEIENLILTINMIYMLARLRPMINDPRVYSLRLHVPFHLNRLAYRGYPVPSFTADFNRPDGYEEALPLKLDELKTWEVLSFPKNMNTDLKVWRKKPKGIRYTLFVVGERIMEEALCHSDAAALPRKIKTVEVPEPVVATVLKIASDVGIKFCESTVVNSEAGLWLSQIDTAPNFKNTEDINNLDVSSALADYLINIAGDARK